jgi:hypothetical protein
VTAATPRDAVRCYVRRMRRLTRIFVAATLVVPVVALAAPAHASGPCDLAPAPGEAVAHRMTRIIRCAAHRWPVDGGAERAICIADHESGLDPKAKSDHGAYLGIYQHSAIEWPERYATWTRSVWGLDDRALVGRTNIIVAIRMANADGWGAWRGTGC